MAMLTNHLDLSLSAHRQRAGAGVNGQDEAAAVLDG